MYGNERNVPMMGVWRRAWRMTGKNDLKRASAGGEPGARLRRDLPEETDEANEFDADARDRPLEKHEQATDVSSGKRRLNGTPSTNIPPKKQTVPRHFSLREKK
jgi:hypothetical protein